MPIGYCLVRSGVLEHRGAFIQKWWDMIRFFVAIQSLVKRCHVHWFRFHHATGANVYTECRCGMRNWYSLSGGYSPVNYAWINAKQ